MKIKRSSWHYKLSVLGSYENSTDNLCNYFWRLVFKVVFFPLLAFVLFVFFWLVFTNPVCRIVALAILYLSLSIFLPVIAVSAFRKKFGVFTEAPGENILKSFINAKKDKLCLMIEYVD